MLLQWCGGNKYDFYDELQVSDDEWEKSAIISVEMPDSLTFLYRMKETGEQYDDRVVEVAWNIPEQNWKILRFRDDKTHGNHRDVVASVVESILDGVEMDLVRIAPHAHSKLKADSFPTAHQGSARNPSGVEAAGESRRTASALGSERSPPGADPATSHVRPLLPIPSQ